MEFIIPKMSGFQFGNRNLDWAAGVWIEYFLERSASNKTIWLKDATNSGVHLTVSMFTVIIARDISNCKHANTKSTTGTVPGGLCNAIRKKKINQGTMYSPITPKLPRNQHLIDHFPVSLSSWRDSRFHTTRGWWRQKIGSANFWFQFCACIYSGVSNIFMPLWWAILMYALLAELQVVTEKLV